MSDGKITRNELHDSVNAELNKVGNLLNINTVNKSDIVSAVNEVNTNSITHLAQNLQQLNTNTSAITSNANAIVATASGAPSTQYATIALLTTAIPAGNTKAYLMSDGYWASWNGTAWIEKGIYQGTVPPDGSSTFNTISKALINSDVTYKIYQQETNDDMLIDFVVDLTSAIAGSLITTSSPCALSYNLYSEDVNISQISWRLFLNTSNVAGNVLGGDITYATSTAYLNANSMKITSYSGIKGNLPTIAYNFAHVLVAIKLTDRTKYTTAYINTLIFTIGGINFAYNPSVGMYQPATGSYVTMGTSFYKALVTHDYADTNYSQKVNLLSDFNSINQSAIKFDKYDVLTNSGTNVYIQYLFDINAQLANLSGTEKYEAIYDIFSKSTNIKSLQFQIFANSDSNIDNYSGGLIDQTIYNQSYLINTINHCDMIANGSTLNKSYRYVRLCVTLPVTDVTVNSEVYIGNVQLKLGQYTFSPIGNKPLFMKTGYTQINAFINPLQIARILDLPVIPTIPSISKWVGKKWNVIGDSFTEINSRTTKNYEYFIQDLIGCTINNYGISGTGWRTPSTNGGTNAIYQRISTMDTTADLITVWAGTNDYAEVGISWALGALGDTTVATLYGAIDNVINQLIAQYPTKTIAIFTPLPDGGMWGAKTQTMQQVADAIIQVANKYGKPVLDLFRINDLNINNATAKTYYFTDGSGNTTPHPNYNGHNSLKDKILSFLNTL